MSIQQLLLAEAASAGGPTISSPTDLTGLIGWWDSSVLASLHLTGSTLNSIDDQSGSDTITGGLNAFASPTYSATNFNTSHPGILVDTAVGSAMETASGFPMGTGNTLTIFCVGTNTQTSSNADARMMSYVAPGGTGHDSDNNGSWVLSRVSASNSQIAFSRNSGSFSPTVVTFTAGNRVFAVTVDSSGNVFVYVDGVVTVAQATTSAGWVSGGILAVGHEAGRQFSAYATGTFAEWGVATGFHTSTQIGQLTTALKTKWGL